jgi:pimeloyl-ACP methyl ester carboxylesterase
MRLHGYSIGADQWTHEIHVPQTVEGAFAQGAKEMIVVLPDSKTLHNGSMYSSSVTTGDFEKFISHDVVAYMDAHYRTIPDRKSRGLVGHSMGGYGATRIGMKHSDVFGSLYIMSPCCLSARTGGPANPEIDKALDAVKTPQDSANLPFFARAQLASAAAWSPDPKNPPLYLDLPMKDGLPGPRCWLNGRPTRPSPLSINTLAISANTARSHWTWGTRTAYVPIPASCTTFSIYTEFRTALRCIQARTPAPWRIAFRIMSLPFFSKNLCVEAGCH